PLKGGPFAVAGARTVADRRRTGPGPGRPSGRGGVDRPGRLVLHVARPEGARPAGELEEDPVGILEVHRPDVDVVGDLVGQADLGVVVVGDLGALHAGGDEPVAVLLDALGWDGERHVVHRADGAGEGALVGSGRRGRHA